MALVFLGVVVETPAPPRPGAVPPAGAAAAMAAAAALALRGGGVPAFLKTDYVVLRSDGSEGKRRTPPSRTYLAAALRACGGVDRPPLVASRASEFVTELAARRRMRGALLRRLAEVMADVAAAPTGVDPDTSLAALDEDARVTICVRALGLARRAGDLARRDRAVAAQLSILAAHANLRGDRAALDGDVSETGTETKMFLKLRARAACDAARRTDRDSLVAASRNAVRLLGDASPDVRVAAAGALKALATVLVAAEASFAAAAVASRVGECHADRGDADVPAGRWSVPRDDWEQGLGEGDDDMAPEGVAVAEAAGEEAAEEEAAEKKAAAPKRSRHADFGRPGKEDGRGGDKRLGSSSDGEAETRALDPGTNEPRPRPRPRDVEKGKEYRTTTTATAKMSAATDPLEGVFVPPDVSRRFDSARMLVSLDRAAREDTHPGARDALFAARDAVAAARARALSAARRVATGGVLGAHVAAWAALTADAPLPGVVDAAARLKFEALVRPTRRRIAEARRLSRQEVDAAAAGDVDVEAARRLESEARAATEAAAAAYGLIDAPAGEDVSAAALFAAVEGEIGAFPRPSGPAAKLESSNLESSNPRNPKSPRHRVTSPGGGAAPPPHAPPAYLARVKAQARRGADAPDAPLTAGELVRTTGPTPQTVAAVRVMLGRSIAKQHERHEHAARARVANRWREAREKDARRAAVENQPPHLLRKGTTKMKTNATNVSVSQTESKEGARSRAPVDLASLRAARREAPPGGDMQLSRPTGSRPALERTRATEAFRRVAETRAPDAVAARRAKQLAEEAAKAARKAEVSRRYYGAETFKKPVVKKNLDADGPRVVKDSSGRTWMM
jgi:hypothetical protein